MPPSKRPTILAKVKCRTCKTVFEFRRKASKQKKAGHLKHVYCLNCREITIHEELRD